MGNIKDYEEKCEEFLEKLSDEFIDYTDDELWHVINNSFGISLLIDLDGVYRGAIVYLGVGGHYVDGIKSEPDGCEADVFIHTRWERIVARSPMSYASVYFGDGICEWIDDIIKANYNYKVEKKKIESAK